MARKADDDGGDWFAQVDAPPADSQPLVPPPPMTTGTPLTVTPTDPNSRDYIRQQLTNLYQQLGQAPGGRGTGPTDIEYYIDRILQTGGWTGDNANYWTSRITGDVQGGGAGGATDTSGLASGALLQPWTQNFQPVPWTGGTFQPPAWTGGTFQPPTALTEQNDPGFQARLAMGQQALERSAAAKGTLLSGGFQKALNQYAQDYASTEYGNVYNRALGQYQQQYGQYQDTYTRALQQYQQQYGQYQDAYSRGLNEYLLNRENFYQNQDRPFNKLLSVSDLGARTAGGLNTTLGSYYSSLLAPTFRPLTP